MAIVNGYLTLDEYKQTLDANTSVHDQRLEEAIEAASRQIDGWCRRRFFLDALATARTYRPRDVTCLSVHDIGDDASVVLKVDYGDDGTFEQTVTAYELTPADGILDGLDWAFTGIELVDGWSFPLGGTRRAVQVTAKWGWPAVPLAVKMACRLQTTRLFSGQKAPFGVIEVQDGFNARMPRMHPEVEALLLPYRRDQVLVS